VGHVGLDARTSGGYTPYSLISANTANATSVKASAGMVYQITASNTNAAVRYLKLYDKATAPAETDTPVCRIALPGATTGGMVVANFTHGLAFANGIGLRLTTGVADNNTDVVAADEILVNLAYK
jgi:hypothetical protein